MVQVKLVDPRGSLLPQPDKNRRSKIRRGSAWLSFTVVIFPSSPSLTISTPLREVGTPMLSCQDLKKNKIKLSKLLHYNLLHYRHPINGIIICWMRSIKTKVRRVVVMSIYSHHNTFSITARESSVTSHLTLTLTQAWPPPTWPP